MSDEPGKEKYRIGFFQIGWIEQEGIRMIKITRMIQGHNHHNDAPHNVDGGDPGLFREHVSCCHGQVDSGSFTIFA
jgi:hypothetical protein